MKTNHKTPSGKLRARALGLKFLGETGIHNNITDVAGVSVGYTTIIKGNGPLLVGSGPVRTGVTAILLREVMMGLGINVSILYKASNTILLRENLIKVFQQLLVYKGNTSNNAIIVTML